MEGVPRLYMIGLPIKQYSSDSENPDFFHVIYHHIDKTYGRIPSLYEADTTLIPKLRNAALLAIDRSRKQHGPPEESLTITPLKQYYAHLVQLTNKFPEILQHSSKETQQLSKAEKERLKGPDLIFAWKRGLGTGKNKRRKTPSAVDHGDIGYEMRCILYNIGAAHTRLACAQDRSPPLGGKSSPTSLDEEAEPTAADTALKVACTHLQCAAWAFQQLLGGSQHDTSPSSKQQQHLLRQYRPPVTGRAVLEFAYAVTLGQAQECILEKSMTDGRKSLIIAKVSAMICEYFAGAVLAVRRAEHDMQLDRKQRIVGAGVGPARLEKWRLYAEFKCRYYGAVTALFQGQHAHDQLRQMGVRVSYYKRAVNLLRRASRSSEDLAAVKNSDDDYESDDTDEYYRYYITSHSDSAIEKELEMRRDTLGFAMDVAGAKYASGKSENELIYHEPVTAVVSDDDDAGCFVVTGLLDVNRSASSSNYVSGNPSAPPDRVKGAALVKPIGFAADDPELLTVFVESDGSEKTSKNTLLFHDLVPPDVRQRAADYREEKRKADVFLHEYCHELDEEMTVLAETLQLECLDMYKNAGEVDEDSKDDVKTNTAADLPQKLINCCAAYQALLQQHRDAANDDPAVEEDVLVENMTRLGSTVRAVDDMLDEIEQHLKTEEQADAEFRRTTGRAYDYGVGRMRELRLEAQRYRKAHVGPARDSWHALTRALGHLQLLALSPTELAARLPGRPTRASVAASIVEAHQRSTNDASSVATENNKKTTNRVDENSEDSQQQSRQQLEIKESIERMDRLAQVVGKMHEMREQRKTLMQRWRDELKLDNSKDVELEGRQPVVAPQDDVDLLRELGGGGGRPSAVDLMPSFRLFEVRLGEVFKMINYNFTAQTFIKDGVQAAYAETAAERRAYANAIRAHRTAIDELIETFDNVVVGGGKGIGAIDEDGVDEENATAAMASRHPHAVLAARCVRGLEFYQRLRANVAKLLQRVKGTCQVQTEQRDQMIRQHQLAQTRPDADSDGGDDDGSGGGGFVHRAHQDTYQPNPAAVLTTADNQLAEDDTTALENLIATFDLQDIEGLEDIDFEKLPSLPSGHWAERPFITDGRRRRLSPLGSEHQLPSTYYQQYHQQQQQQIIPQLPQCSWSNADYAKYYAEQKAVAAAAATTKYGYVDPVAAALQQRQLLLQQQQKQLLLHQIQQRQTASTLDVRGCATTAAVVNTIATLTSPSAYSSNTHYRDLPRHLPSVASSPITNTPVPLPAVSSYSVLSSSTSASSGMSTDFPTNATASTAMAPTIQQQQQQLLQYDVGGYQHQQSANAVTSTTSLTAQQQQQQHFQLYQQQEQQLQQQFQLQQQQLQLQQQYRQQQIANAVAAASSSGLFQQQQLSALSSPSASVTSSASNVGGVLAATPTTGISKFFPKLQLEEPSQHYQPQQQTSQLYKTELTNGTTGATMATTNFYQQQTVHQQQAVSQVYQPSVQQQQPQLQQSQLQQPQLQQPQIQQPQLQQSLQATSQMYYQPQQSTTSQLYHQQQPTSQVYLPPQQQQQQQHTSTSQLYQPQQHQSTPQLYQQQQAKPTVVAPNTAPVLQQQPLQHSLSIDNSNNYYQQLLQQQQSQITTSQLYQPPQQQHHNQQTTSHFYQPPSQQQLQQPQTTTQMIAPTTPIAATVSQQDYYFHQPTSSVSYNQYQQQQQYPTAAPTLPVVNLLDDDLLQLPVTSSVPAPIQPEKVGSSTSPATTTAS